MADQIIDIGYRVFHDSCMLEASFDFLRILFVVEGSCSVSVPQEQDVMRKSDVFLLNPMEEAKIEAGEGLLAVVFEIPFFILLKETGRTSLRFYLNSSRESSAKTDQLQFILRGLLMCYLGDPEKNHYQAKGLCYLLLQRLLDDFTVSDKARSAGNERDDKTQEILRYVWTNYRSEISLTDIAERFYLSRSTASRMFKQYTGVDFPEYLKNLRLQAVLAELRNTDHSITDIALNAGFSSPAVLNRVFRETYGMAPGKYREINTVNRTDESTEPDKDKVLEILRAEDQLKNIPQAITKVLIPTQGGEEWSGWKNRILNVGPVISLRSASMQKQVLFLADRLNIQLIRLWSPFSDDMMVFDQRSGAYNFSLMDEILDFCVDRRLNIMLDLTIRKDRQMASEKREIYVLPLREPFRDLSAWLSALQGLLLHLRNRYHEEVIRNWVFELTDSLSDAPYHRGGNYSFAEVWEKSYELIRRIIPAARIAGPGLLPDSDMTAQTERIRRFVSSSRVPDIFTSAHFPYRKTGVIDSHGTFEKNTARDFFETETANIRKTLDSEGFRGEYWVTEYGISTSNRNYLQDSCYRAAAIVDEVLPVLDKVDAVGVFYASDLLSAFSDTMAELSGGGGLLTKNGVRKPAYYGFRFIGQLGNIRLAATGSCFASAFQNGDIRILCWNRKYLGPRYYMIDEDSFGFDEVADFLEDTNPMPMQLEITGLEENAYRIRSRIINMERGSVVKKWIELGSFENLSRDDIEYLSQTAVPEVLSEVRTPSAGRILLTMRLEINELRMIVLQRM